MGTVGWRALFARGKWGADKTGVADGLGTAGTAWGTTSLREDLGEADPAGVLRMTTNATMQKAEIVSAVWINSVNKLTVEGITQRVD